MTLRRLRVLIKGLPSDSLYVSKLRGITDGRRWGDMQELLASMYDISLAQYGVAYVGVTSKKPPNMKPYPRPERLDHRKADPEEANAEAETLLELWSSGALADQAPPGHAKWIKGAPADHRNGLLPSGIEDLPETGETTTTE
ncbi:hypothetical protein ACFYPZ_24530 [Streptomyces sp. NPDC005506]|uniref:hypothetical protein n=1 Tax=Streptomyces sp. NPDC005506 TaxID=3364718 RepID=UPI0036945136